MNKYRVLIISFMLSNIVNLFSQENNRISSYEIKNNQAVFLDFSYVLSEIKECVKRIEEIRTYPFDKNEYVFTAHIVNIDTLLNKFDLIVSFIANDFEVNESNPFGYYKLDSLHIIFISESNDFLKKKYGYPSISIDQRSYLMKNVLYDTSRPLSGRLCTNIFCVLNYDNEKKQYEIYYSSTLPNKYKFNKTWLDNKIEYVPYDSILDYNSK